MSKFGYANLTNQGNPNIVNLPITVVDIISSHFEELNRRRPDRTEGLYVAKSFNKENGEAVYEWVQASNLGAFEQHFTVANKHLEELHPGRMTIVADDGVVFACHKNPALEVVPLVVPITPALEVQ